MNERRELTSAEKRAAYQPLSAYHPSWLKTVNDRYGSPSRYPATLDDFGSLGAKPLTLEWVWLHEDRNYHIILELKPGYTLTWVTTVGVKNGGKHNPVNVTLRTYSMPTTEQMWALFGVVKFFPEIVLIVT